jgi:type I restriction enzyme M protein
MGPRLLDHGFERLLADCHDVARAVDGLHADEAVDEICKLLQAKLLDEREGGGRFGAGAEQLRALAHATLGSPLRLSDQALLRIAEQLGRLRLGGSRADLKGRAFQRLLAPAIRAGMGQYLTPEPIVELAVDVARPRPGERVLDPFCGSGRFLLRAFHAAGARDLHGIEKSDRMARIAATDALLHDGCRIRLRVQDALLPLDDDGFDVVLTNPPFGGVLRAEELSGRVPFELAQGRRSLPLELLGLERSLQLLRPGGRLAIVLPEHVLKGKRTAFARDWLDRVARLRAIFSLPEDAFSAYGAAIRTCLCLLERLAPGEQAGDQDEVFLCELANLGYDATGRPRPGEDVSEAAAAYLAWAGGA